jgi:hypothetical protein
MSVPPGNYTVTVTDGKKCTQSMTFTVPALTNGPCCKVKPNANPLIDCSDPIMNFGNSTVEFGHNRCVAANGGNSCFWDFSNPICCYPGAQGCGQTSGTTCAPPAVSLAYPFSALNVSTPGYSDLLEKCLKEAEASGMANYHCCVTLPGSLNLSAKAKSSCTGKAGGIDLTVSGGTPPYFYNWSNGQTVQDPVNLGSGNYTVTVTDSSQPQISANLTVGVLAIGPVVINGSVINATQPNYNNGSINISVAPALGYNYNWIKVGGGWPGSNTEDIQNLTPGSYTVTATNKFSCKATKTFKVLKTLSPIKAEIMKSP